MLALAVTRNAENDRVCMQMRQGNAVAVGAGVLETLTNLSKFAVYRRDNAQEIYALRCKLP